MRRQSSAGDLDAIGLRDRSVNATNWNVESANPDTLMAVS
jgi:hypothetical protein